MYFLLYFCESSGQETPTSGGLQAEPEPESDMLNKERPSRIEKEKHRKDGPQFVTLQLDCTTVTAAPPRLRLGGGRPPETRRDLLHASRAFRVRAPAILGRTCRFRNKAAWFACHATATGRALVKSLAMDAGRSWLRKIKLYA